MTTSSTPSRLGRSNMVSSRMASIIERRPRAPVLRSIALRAMAPSASSASVRSIDSISNSRWYCLTSAFFGCVRISLSEGSSRSSSVATTGRRPTNSGIRPYLSRSSGSTARRNDLVEASESAAAHEQDVGRVDLQEFLLRMLAAALRRHRSNGAFHDLEQRLLHAFARDVARDGRVVRFAADLVDFVDIDDAALRTLDVVVGVLQQLENDVLDILADIAGFGERRRIGHGERHVQDARQGLRQQGLAAARRADEHDVRFRQLDIAVLAGRIDALVVVVHRDREDLLRVLLADDIIVEHLVNFLRGRHALLGLHKGGLVLLPDDFHAEFDAFVADENRRAGNELANFVLALAAEGTVERIFRLAAARLAHKISRTPGPFSSGIDPSGSRPCSYRAPKQRHSSSFDHVS